MTNCGSLIYKVARDHTSSRAADFVGLVVSRRIPRTTVNIEVRGSGTAPFFPNAEFNATRKHFWVGCDRPQVGSGCLANLILSSGCLAKK